MAVYSQRILEHYKNPRNKGSLEDAALRAKKKSPLCGCADWVEISLLLEGERIKKAKFRGEGCVVSVAAASLLTEALQGILLAEALGIDEGKFRQIFGEKISPFRESCAFLSLEALQDALRGEG
jgi:nitrogen fixation NifU-like protein